MASTYPPDISCWPHAFEWDPYVFEDRGCTISNNMVNFLNLTGPNWEPYFKAYCTTAPKDDACPFGFCPNPDIAGPLVRVGNYLTGFCLTILMFYSPGRVYEAFWSQIFITYSLLITCGIALRKKEVSRFHTFVLVTMVCSPANVYFIGYSIRAFWSTHNLDAVLGKKQYIKRATVFFSLVVWIILLVYVYLPQHLTEFSQNSCRGSSIVENLFLATPFIFAWELATRFGGYGIFLLFVFLSLPIFLVICWVVVIILRRKEIWPPGEPYSPRFGAVWRTVSKNFPFLRFSSVIAVPTAFWIAAVEIGIATEHDSTFELTFGQILALFAAVPPMIQVASLAPLLWGWIAALAGVKLKDNRPNLEDPDPEGTAASNPVSVGDKEGVNDAQRGQY